MRILMPLLALLGLPVVLLALGQALEPTAMKHADQVSDVVNPAQPFIGEHGEAVWYWPDLPADSVTFTQTYTVPFSCDFRGLRIVTFGGIVPGDARGLWAVSVSANGQPVFQEEGVLFSGAGLAEDFLPSVDDVPVSVALVAGQQLRVSLSRAFGNYPPWLSADGDCIFPIGQSASVRTASMASAQTIERDLCIRVLVDQPAGDAQGPALDFGRFSSWPLANRTLPLRVGARDPSGVSDLLVATWQDGSDTLWTAATRPDSLLNEFLAAPEIDGFDPGPLFVRLEASDSLGNTSDSLLTVTLDQEPLLWAGESGRIDQLHSPGFPVLGGSASAIRLSLEDFPAESELLSFVPIGGQTHVVGTGSCRMRLVPDREGMPWTTASGELLDATLPVLVPGQDICAGWRDFAFGAVTDSLRDSAAWWIVQEYITGQELFICAEAPAEEGGAPGNSWSFNPTSQVWIQDSALAYQLRVRVEALSCDTAVPFQADFDNSYQNLECWITDHVEPGSAGWLLGSRSGPNNPRSLNFTPLGSYPPGDQANGESTASDTLHVPSVIAYINSETVEQLLQDSLYTPWVDAAGNGTLQVRFLSYYGNYIEGTEREEARVIGRVRQVDGTVGPWQPKLDPGTLFATDTLTIQGSVFDLPIWTWRSTQFSGLAAGSAVQLGFVYRGQAAYGWAIDSLSIDVPSLSVQSPGPGLVSISRTWPNPFNPSTTIEFLLREWGPVDVDVYNLLGQRVQQVLVGKTLWAGTHQVEFSPQGLASGIYFVRIASRGQVDQRRIVFVK
ncbi:MAG: T9SS type A sorting domain-containing protein [Candidatus Delongbacteria bacterium]|nr:T9SS type A sorting domain-containing protein [Candidatus Delongbacteria bacterium]